jgi:putative ABC transport system permease protein
LRPVRDVLSLMIGLMLVIIMSIIQHSFKTSIGDWNDRTLRSDLWVSSIGRVLTVDVQPLAETLGAEIDRISGVDVIDDKGARGFRIVHHTYAGKQIVLKALEPQHPRVGNAWFDVIDRPVADAARALFDAKRPAVMVSQNFATHFGKRLGDTLELDTPSGKHSFEIVGTAVDYGSPEGVLYMSREVYKERWRDPLVTGFAVEVAPGFTHEGVKASIDAKLGERGLVATMNRELRAQFDEVMDESFGYTKAIELAALGVGLLGLLTTLLMSIFDRMREMGMLRAIGMSRRQLVAMVACEATLLGLFGGAVAALLGAYIAKLWVVSSLATSLGWIVRVHVPYLALVTTLATGLFVGVIAGLLCARRVATLDIRVALETS